MLRLLGLDRDRFGTRDWNPLATVVRPGDTVLIKPNLARDFHGRGLSTDSIVTHGSVVRAMLDYILIALEGRGTVIVGDAPLQQTRFEVVVERNGLRETLENVRRRSEVEIRLVDFRRERGEKDGLGRIRDRIPLGGDPLGHTAVDLGQESFLAPIQDRYERFRVTNYDPVQMTAHHNALKHEYLIANSVLTSDVVINLPKLKTHAKAGVTLALKNLVGINASKDWLPHHTIGSRDRGGDEYSRPDWLKALNSRLLDMIESAGHYRVAQAVDLVRHGILGMTRRAREYHDPYWEGSWWGNDTIWRTVLDLNLVALYADRGGRLRGQRQRRYFSLVDGIVAGEGNGPLSPDPRHAGVLVGGFEPASVDYACALLMGFDPTAISLVREAMRSGLFGPNSEHDIEVVTAFPEWSSLDAIAAHHLGFVPPKGWLGHVERKDGQSPDRATAERMA